MSSILKLDTSMNYDDYEQEQQRQYLLAERAAIDAKLAAIPLSLPQTTHQHRRSPIHKPHQSRRSSHVPRSVSNIGVSTMSRHLSSDRLDMSQRPRSISQRSATSMARVNSRGSSSQHQGNMPFSQNGVAPPPLQSESRRDNPVMMDFINQDQQPLTAYTLSHQEPQFQPTIPHRALEQVPELDFVGENPGDFILRTMNASLSPSTSIPSSATVNNHRLSTSSYYAQTPSTPTSLTTATTLASDMSRQASLCTGLESMQFPSNNSFPPDLYNDQPMYDHVTHSSFSRHVRRSSDEEQSQLLTGTGGASIDSQFSQSFQVPSSAPFGEKMEKSQSSESSSSSSSRNVKRLQDQISLAAARPLMPKGGCEDVAMSREASSQSMIRIESKDGSLDKVAISNKPSYQRPKHDRVYCNICENHPEGFRGEHELRRHKDREHQTMVKKFMCIEPNDGLPHPKPVVPLSRCKACTQQKKKYGAYYNAAAHLRRAHFNPKSKGKNKNQQKAEDEKRGGKAGGDWPPMSECKLWMKEVEEQVEYLTDAQQEAADAADASDDEAQDNSFDDQLYSQQSTQSMGSNNTFDNSYTDISPMISLYPNTVNLNSNDMYGMQNMPLDLSGAGQPTQCMDNTMYIPQPDAYTFSSDPSQNDFMPFLENSSLQPNYNGYGWS